MAPTICSLCGDAVEEGYDSWAEHAELDASSLSERLKLKCYYLKRKINQLQSPIVRRLHPDVMSTIFEFCLPDFTDHHYIGDYIYSIPLSLGAICSYWREIAWSTPCLWSSLAVRVTGKHAFRHDWDLLLITCIAQEWLTRSGQLPLSIRISSTSYNKIYSLSFQQRSALHYEHRAVSALADIINQYSSRWSNLDLYLHGSCYRYFHATDNRAPILKFIRFYYSSYPDMKKLNFRPLTCPRLERASLEYFPMEGTNIQFDNLSHLTLYSMSIFDSFLILRTTPRLVFFEISGSCAGRREASPGVLVLQLLRSLRLLIRNSESAEYFLNNLTAPHLEEFELPTYYNPSMEVVTSFLTRSSCSLRSFAVIFSIFPPYFEGLMNLLQSMPSLDLLSLLSITTIVEGTPEDYDPRNILQLVARVLASQSSSQPRYLPNLKILEYTGKLNPRPGNYDDLHPLLPADNAIHGPLHLFKLDITQHRIPKNMISHLSRLVERGLAVNLLSKSEDIFQSSIDYFGRRDDFFGGDWADNLESNLFS